MFLIESSKKKDNTIMAIKGNATIEHAEKIKKGFDDAFKKGNKIELSLKDIKKADLSFFQILIAFYRLAQKESVEFAIAPLKANPIIQKELEGLGFFHSPEIKRLFNLGNAGGKKN